MEENAIIADIAIIVINLSFVSKKRSRIYKKVKIMENIIKKISREIEKHETYADSNPDLNLSKSELMEIFYLSSSLYFLKNLKTKSLM